MTCTTDKPSRSEPLEAAGVCNDMKGHRSRLGDGPIVRFAAPFLSLVAARVKTLDMRLVDDKAVRRLRPGSLVVGRQAASGDTAEFEHVLRVTHIRYFASPALAYDYYQGLHMHHGLFPPAWCMTRAGDTVSTSAVAEAYFLENDGRRAAGWTRLGANAVRVMTIEPVDAPPGSVNSCPAVPGLPEPPAQNRIQHMRPREMPAMEPTSRGRPMPVTPVVSPEMVPCVEERRPYLPLTAAAVEAVVEQGDANAQHPWWAHVVSGGVQRRPQYEPEAALLERLVADARHRARTRGASVVTARDFAAAAAKEAGQADPGADPAAELPTHFDEVVDALAALRTSARSQLGGSLDRAPRVLVVGEVHATVARMFARAGADVATCDLQPSEASDIPHFEGDASHIIDLGWDLVIGHPPCTYLANSGVVWLHRDPDRWEHCLSNADTFRRIIRARAPFVAVENSKMHRYGRALVGVDPTQYVHPWQHGTGHTKPTALYLRNLPLLRPTAVVAGRKHALARLPPSINRSARRSRTYVGIAAAMAMQWMPVLVEHASSLTADRPTAAEMVRAAQIPCVARCHIVFVRHASAQHPYLDVITSGEYRVPPTVPIEPLSTGSIPAQAVSKWISEEVLLPRSWVKELEEALRYYPTGHDTTTSTRCYGCGVDLRAMVHTWVVDVSRLGSSATPSSRDATTHSFEWTPLTDAQPSLESDGFEVTAFHHLVEGAVNITRLSPAVVTPPVVPRVEEPALAVVAASEVKESQLERPRRRALLESLTESLPESRFPWLHEHPDLPPPPPPTKHVRYWHGHWHAWQPTPSSEGNRPFGWQPLPKNLDMHLTAALRPRARLPAVINECYNEGTSISPATEDPIVAVARPVRQQMSLDGLRRLWDERPRPRDESTLGLGADPASKPGPSTRELSQVGCFEYYWSLQDRWCAGAPIPAEPQCAPVAGAEMSDKHAEVYQLALNRQWDVTAQLGGADGSTGSTGAIVVASATPDITEDDIALTPKSTRCHHALYIQHLRLLRQARTRKGLPQFYNVNCAVAEWSRSLADTGAGPSIATTGFLHYCPLDACVSRDVDAQVGPLTGADGQPLRTEGTVDLTFALDGTPCRHTFVVVVGKPLLLFGNDFFSQRKAVISMNEDGEGEGRVELTSENRKGRAIRHTVRVSNQPPRANMTDATAVALAETGATSTPVNETGGSADEGSTAETSDKDTSEPLPAAELADEAMKAGSWKLEQSEYLLYAHRAVPLAPRAITTTRLVAPCALREKHATCFVDRLPERDGLGTTPLVLARPARIVDGYIELQIVNLSRHTVTLPALSPVAMLDSEYYVRGTVDPSAIAEADGHQDYYSALSEAERQLVDSVVVDPGNRLSVEQKERVKQLLARHVSAFALDPKNPSKTHLMEVELPLIPGAQPHRHAASRLGEAGREIVEKHIEEMESRGIIRKSNSPWGSRVVLVTKKDGSIRFCVDYRDTNSKLEVQDSPLPLAVEAIDRLSSGQGPQSSLFLSTLDLASGFWCLPIKEEDKKITAFTTHRSKYEFNYLPFGIQSGPSYMCRLMDAALQGLAWETCMPYLDDVGVWSTGKGATPEEREASSFEQMLQRLGGVFERLKWAGLSMKASKCTLFATSAEYLGHVISRDGLHMDPKKISAVKEIDPTSINTVTKVRSFLGLCSYYRRFIKGFSRTAACLHDLTKDGVDIAVLSQSQKCQEAIKALIASITSEPVLATPRFDRPFILATDAANTEGVGGVLKQVDDEGRERVIAYYGRKLNDAERHYTVTEIELLAAMESIKHWRMYLWGRKFKLVIDHVALRWLHTMRDTMEGGPASRLMRWILKLQEYNFTVEHKPGIIHKDADGVSRLVCPACLAGNDYTGPTDPELTGFTDPDHVQRLTADTWVTPVQRAGVLTARRVQHQQRRATDRAAITAEYLQTGAPSLETLRTEQRSDALCIAIRQYLERGHAGDVADTKGLRQAAWLAREVCPYIDGAHRERIFVQDDLLYRRLTPDLAVPFVPTALRWAIIEAYHDHMGHPSAKRTEALIRSRYYWPGMGAQCAEHVAGCHECTLAARPSARPRQPVGPTVGHYPFDVLYADILSMTKTHDYDEEKGTGASKLIVFVDSLSRWVEAIPLHKDPTSEQVLDIFMEHVVSRHGVPRRVVTDHGSNLASRLCRLIMKKTEVDLSPSTAEHHEAVGLVERVQQTLVGMTRAANEGGSHWVDHLPFLLMSYRATPHRVTKLSPAMLLYGRELRLPAQLHTDTGAADLSSLSDKESVVYARRLHDRLVYAWRSAREHTRAAQGATVSDTVRSAATPPQFAVNDRVARRLYDSANKLSYTYAGPYRVKAVLGNGRYELTDLENNNTVSEFDVSNLRRYNVLTDAEQLQSDEYLVEKLLRRRSPGGRREYLVKWRGYPRSAATWLPQAELQRRCAELVVRFDAENPADRRIRHTRPLTSPVEPAEAVSPKRVDPAVVPTHLPHAARFVRGAWSYARNVTTPRGLQQRWLPATNFTSDELKSDHYSRLRADAGAVIESDVFVSAVLAVEPELTPDELPLTRHAAKVWFVRHHAAGPQVLSFERADSDIARPQYDTFGGKMDHRDDQQYNRCALRELREEAVIPKPWMEDLGDALVADPDGQTLVNITRRFDGSQHRVAFWVVHVPTDVATRSVRPTKAGAREMRQDTLAWRPVSEVVSNLEGFHSFNAYGGALRRLVNECETLTRESGSTSA